ncbi:MAG: hypothetical protein ACPGU7_10925 [Gammaproteobacteria bacterium]
MNNPIDSGLPRSRAALGTDAFARILKEEMEQLPPAALPLQAGLRHSSAVAPRPFKIVVLSVTTGTEEAEARVGVFYAGVIAGCNCADDPTPMDEENEHCELSVRWVAGEPMPRIELLD